MRVPATMRRSPRCSACPLMSNWPDRPRALIAYPYAKTLGVEAWQKFAGFDLILDSGAFTAMNTGKPVDVDEYTDFCDANRDRFALAFALDVIGDHRASMRNYRRQQDALGVGFPLVPTWHMGTALKELDSLCAETGYVSIGGAVPFLRKRTQLGRVMVEAHRIAARHGTVLHGLGMSGAVAVDFPWRSVDSASWTIPGRMPLAYLAHRDGSMTSMKYGDRVGGRNASTLAAYGGDRSNVERYGFSSAKHVGPQVSRGRVQWAVVAAIRSFMWLEAVKRDRGNLKFKMFLAMGGYDPRVREAHAAGPAWPVSVVGGGER